MRIIGLFTVIFLAACVPDLSTICPHKTSITQGVFGGIVDSNNTQEQNVEVDLYTMENGVQSTTATFTAETTRGGYELNVTPSTYILCAKSVCGTSRSPRAWSNSRPSTRLGPYRDAPDAARPSNGQSLHQGSGDRPVPEWAVCRAPPAKKVPGVAGHSASVALPRPTQGL